MGLIRTQVYLEPLQHRRLKRKAQELDISLAHLIRQIVDRHLNAEEGTPHFTEKDFMSIVGIGESAASEVSIKHDHYLGEAAAGGHSR